MGIYGVATVVREAYPDHTAFDPSDQHFDPKSDPANPTWMMVDVGYVGTFKEPITLATLKQTPKLEKMLVIQRGSRLSVQPVTPEEWDIVMHVVELVPEAEWQALLGQPQTTFAEGGPATMSPAAKPIEGHVMQLPPQLVHAIALETAQHNLRSLTQAATELSEHYRSQRSASGMFMATAAHRLARRRTHAGNVRGCRTVFTELRRLMPDRRIMSLLDLGTGPGTAGWAALEVFDEVQEITLVEQDAGWIRTGKSLACTGENVRLAQADWVHANVRAVTSFQAHDLVVSSYVLGEMAPQVAREIVQAAWAAARTAIVIIEPGTMRGFELMRLLRGDLIALGGHVIAPCPHQDDCPMRLNDWCHFAQRFARASLHRRIKGGTLGYEDEKFSYIVVAKHLGQPVNTRVVRHPLRHAGHTRLRLCTGDGLQTITVMRSDNEHWQRARKIEWGEQWS